MKIILRVMLSLLVTTVAVSPALAYWAVHRTAYIPCTPEELTVFAVGTFLFPWLQVTFFAIWLVAMGWIWCELGESSDSKAQ